MTSGERCGKIIDEWTINGEYMDYKWRIHGLPVVPRKAVAEVSKIGNL